MVSNICTHPPMSHTQEGATNADTGYPSTARVAILFKTSENGDKRMLSGCKPLFVTVNCSKVRLHCCTSVAVRDSLCFGESKQHLLGEITQLSASADKQWEIIYGTSLLSAGWEYSMFAYWKRAENCMYKYFFLLVNINYSVIQLSALKAHEFHQGPNPSLSSLRTVSQHAVTLFGSYKSNAVESRHLRTPNSRFVK